MRGMYPKRAAPPAIPGYAAVLSDDLCDFNLRLATDMIDRVIVERCVESMPRGILRSAGTAGKLNII